MNPHASKWSLDPDLTFLNHGSFGACPIATLEHQHALRQQLERNPVRFLGREIYDRLDPARDVLAQFVGADPAGLAFVTNATTGVNTVLRSLARHLEPGDEILVTDHGYNACTNAAAMIAELVGPGTHLTTAEIPFPIESSEQVTEAILAKVTDRTALALIDHVTSPTGLIFPIEAIVRALEARGIDTLVDGAHAPGMLPLDLERLGATYYTGNCHKWMCAPKGAAFLHVRADRRDRIRPLVISHGANQNRGDRSFFHVEADWLGTDDPTAFLCVTAAIEFGRSLLPGGWPAWREHNQNLAVQARAHICAALDVPPPAPDAMLGPLASIPLPPRASDAPLPGPIAIDPLQTALFDKDHIEVPVFTYPRAPQRLVRLSAQVYNDIAQYEALATALRREL